MKKKLIILICLMFVVAAAVFAVIAFNNKNKTEYETEENSIRVVTSFYPVYILTLNLTDRIPGIKVDSLTDFRSGCLHDYQLTTDDMRLLSDADVFIINGGGMEEYINDVISGYPNLTIIDLSKGITMLESMEHEGEKNPHVWLDPELYLLQIENARQGLEDYINTTTDKNKASVTEMINTNAGIYKEKVGEIAEEMERILNTVMNMAENNNISNKVGIFHESFAYLAGKAGLNVAFELEIDDDTPLSAGDIAEIIDMIKRENIRYLFAERQHEGTITDRIKEETGAEVYIIDTAVTGDANKDSYLKSMKDNIETLEKAFEGGD